MDVHLSRGVGPGRPNLPLDVGAVEDLLNRATNELPIKWNGIVGPTMLDHVRGFQHDVMHVREPDRRVDPGGGTLRALNRLARNVPVMPTRVQGSPAYAGWSRLDVDAFVDLYRKQFGDAPGGLKTLATAIRRDEDITDIRWMAYMLATAWHETAHTFDPIREFGEGHGRRRNGRRSVKHSAANLRNPRTDHDYGDTVIFVDADKGEDPNVYYGRGYVQLTWWDNYLSAGQRLGMGEDLAIEPDRVMEEGIAYRIMSDGMRNGWFTGVALARFIHHKVCHYGAARQVINGLDRADLIANRAVSIEMLLRLATG
jgi:putative chitinase